MGENVSIVNEEVWSPTKSNLTHNHAFSARTGELTAMCSKRVRPHGSVDADGTGLHSMKRLQGSLSLPHTFCDKCRTEVTRMVERREDSMEPVGIEYLNMNARSI
jgi:hypothetical protein